MVRVGRDQGDRYMPFAFDRQKSIQAVAWLLKTRPNYQDNYMRLLKVLYMADRESIQETGSPITGDAFVAMRHGTMLSRLLNLSKHAPGHLDQNADHTEWRQYISLVSKHDIRLRHDPGRGALCDYEIDKLNEVAIRYEGFDQWDMRDITHKLPEYHDPHKEGKRQKWICLREFLAAVRMESVADDIEEEARADAEFRRLMGR